jgi:RNA polymerase sigma factor (sigma-70 family)
MNALTPSDQQLIRDYLNGRESSLEKIILRYKDKIYAYIFNMVKCHQTADDIFQDTFIKVINTLKSGNYNEEGKFIHWVLRISHNLIIDHFRRNKRIPIQQPINDQDPFERIFFALSQYRRYDNTRTDFTAM